MSLSNYVVLSDDDVEMDEVEEADLLQLDDLALLMDDLCFNFVTLDAPDFYLNPSFKIVFDSRSSYDSIAAASPLSFATGLFDTLQSPDASPVMAFLMSTTVPTGKLWAIYVFILKKAGHALKVYIGSGTHAEHGVSNRLRNYTAGLGKSALPRFVTQALNEGYNIAHHGLLCWTPLPTPGLVPRVRARFLVLETAFTCLFFASLESITDEYHQHLMPWPRSEAEWEPLCSHLPIKEGITGDLGLTPEELDIVAALRVVRRAAQTAEWAANKRAMDPAAWLAHKRAVKNKYAMNNRARVNMWARGIQARAKASLRFYCKPCDHAFASQLSLDRHLSSKGHADTLAGVTKSEAALNGFRCDICNIKLSGQRDYDRHVQTKDHAHAVAGTTRAPPSQYVINSTKVRQDKRARGLYRCVPCNSSFDSPSGLKRHHTKRKHLTAVATLSGKTKPSSALPAVASHGEPSTSDRAPSSDKPQKLSIKSFFSPSSFNA